VSGWGRVRCFVIDTVGSESATKVKIDEVELALRRDLRNEKVMFEKWMFGPCCMKEDFM